MVKNKNIKTNDSKGEFHGYQEWYKDDKLWVRANAKHGRGFGYQEWHIEPNFGRGKITNFMLR
jgi:hypothetical protein